MIQRDRYAERSSLLSVNCLGGLVVISHHTNRVSTSLPNKPTYDRLHARGLPAVTIAVAEKNWGAQTKQDDVSLCLLDESLLLLFTVELLTPSKIVVV
jgi:hypothetical protein